MRFQQAPEDFKEEVMRPDDAAVVYCLAIAPRSRFDPIA